MSHALLVTLAKPHPWLPWGSTSAPLAQLGGTTQKKEQQVLILVFGAAKANQRMGLKEQLHAFALVVKIAVGEALSPDFLLDARLVKLENTATAIASSCALHVEEGASVK